MMETLTDGSAAWWIRECLAAGFLIAGGLFAVVGGLGIVRLPDFYSRLHGGGITDTAGAGLILIGLMVHAGASLVTVKLLMILMFLFIASPSSCHALAKAALFWGVEPELESDRRSGDDRSGAGVRPPSGATGGSPTIGSPTGGSPAGGTS